MNIDITDFRRLQAFMDRVAARPAVKAALKLEERNKS